MQKVVERPEEVNYYRYTVLIGNWFVTAGPGENLSVHFGSNFVRLYSSGLWVVGCVVGEVLCR